MDAWLDAWLDGQIHRMLVDILMHGLVDDGRMDALLARRQPDGCVERWTHRLADGWSTVISAALGGKVKVMGVLHIVLCRPWEWGMLRNHTHTHWHSRQIHGVMEPRGERLTGEVGWAPSPANGTS